MNKKFEAALEEVFQDGWQMRYRRKYGHLLPAREFERKLKKAGITPPLKLHYKYKLPDGLSTKNYELTLDKLSYICYFMPEDLDQFTMSAAWKKWFVQNMKKILAEHDAKVNDQIEQVQKLNPELAHIKVGPKMADAFNFLGGVASGIAPEDIDWYLSEWRPKFEELEKANKTFCSKIKKATGAEPQYVVCPANRKILLAAVTGAK